MRVYLFLSQFSFIFINSFTNLRSFHSIHLFLLQCVCRFDRQGALCETPIVIKNAAFSGDSYVSHRIHKDIPHHESLDTVLPMHVQLKVRTRATNGLIMLAAAQGTKGGHYMALFLQKGLLQFQFSCGLQTMLLSELETPVNTGHEITIRAE